MKPITDDVVHSLLQGVAAREKSGRRSLTKKTSAKIIRFKGATDKGGATVRVLQPSRRTMSGVFCYVSRLRSL